MSEYETLLKRVQSVQDADPAKSLVFVRDVVAERFIEGEIPQDGKPVAITRDNLMDLPGEVFVEALSQITGRSSPNL